MADHAPRYPSYNADSEPYEEPTRHVTPYQFGHPARTNYPDESAPLFLSNYDDYGLDEPDNGYVWVRDGDDAVLVDRYTGEVVEVEYDVFY